jgi:hypothetical protein
MNETQDKLPYHTPQFRVFGTVQELTATDPNTAGADDAMATGWGSDAAPPTAS